MNRLPVLVTALALTALPDRAGAQAAVTLPPRAVTQEPLRLRLDLAADSLDAQSLRTEIERELKRPVALVPDFDAPLSVRVFGDGRLTLAYTRPRAGRVERSVDLPEDRNRATEVVALLVGNVVRDEAGELLQSLEASAPPNSTSEPEPAPALPLNESPAPAPEHTPKPAPAQSQAGEVRDWLGLRSRFDSLRESPVKFNLSLAHPITLLTKSEERRLHFELGLVYSRVGAVEGVALNFGALSVRQHLRGVALGGLYNHVGGATHGVSVSFLYGGGSGSLEGVGLSGLVAYHETQVIGAHVGVGVAITKELEGAQLAGALSLVTRARGATLAGGLNVVPERLEGAAVAGGGNVLGSVRGAALAAGANVVSGDTEGLLATGGLNLTRDLRGISIGLINIARNVEGVQLGLINVASKVDGASLGLVSIAGDGRVQPVFYGSTTKRFHAGVKFLAGHAYSEVGWAYAPVNEAQSLEAGGGLHLPIGNLYLEPGIHFSETDTLNNTPYEAHSDLHHRLRVGLRLFDKLDVFAGGGVLQGINGKTKDAIRGEGFAGLAVF